MYSSPREKLISCSAKSGGRARSTINSISARCRACNDSGGRHFGMQIRLHPLATRDFPPDRSRAILFYLRPVRREAIADSRFVDPPFNPRSTVFARGATGIPRSRDDAGGARQKSSLLAVTKHLHYRKPSGIGGIRAT